MKRHPANLSTFLNRIYAFLFLTTPYFLLCWPFQVIFFSLFSLPRSLVFHSLLFIFMLLSEHIIIIIIMLVLGSLLGKKNVTQKNSSTVFFLFKKKTSLLIVLMPLVFCNCHIFRLTSQQNNLNYSK